MPNIDDLNRAIEERNHKHLESLENLSVEAAEALTNWGSTIRKQTHIKLNDIQSLTTSEKDKNFSSWRDYELCLNGVLDLSPNAAKALAKWKGNRLYLDGVQTLNPDTAKALARSKVDILSLDGVQKLCPDAAKELTKWRGDILSIDGVQQLNLDSARALAKWKGSTEKHFNNKWRIGIISLDGVKNLTSETALALHPVNIVMFSLNGIQILTHETANAFAKWNSRLPYLRGVHDLSHDTAKELAKWRDGALYFHWGPLFENESILCDSAKKIILSIPAVLRKDGQNRLHCDDGPAVVISGSVTVYAIHGMRIKEHIIERPENITIKEIEEEENIEVRRVMIEKYGVDRFLLDSGAKQIHEDSYGSLFRKTTSDEEPIVIVKVRNSTPETDGSFKDYFLRVPPEIKTAHQAIAWTFGIKTNEYQPLLET
jgi:hypothetical protein